MPPEPEEVGSPAEWLRYARGDLAYARAPVPMGAPLEIPCFHAQQAAEKSLKAVLVALGLAFPRTHNIKTLIEYVPPSIVVPSEVQDAAILTDYAVSGRYPGGFEPVEEDERRAAFEHAERLLTWAEEVIAGLDQTT